MFMLPTELSPAWPPGWPADLSTPLSIPSSIPLQARLPFATPAGIVDATRQLAESQLAGCSALMRAALDSSASLFELHVQSTRAQFDAASTASNQLLFVREVRDLVCLTASQSQQALERAQRYGRQVAGVASAAHDRLGELGRDFAGSLPRTPIE